MKRFVLTAVLCLMFCITAQGAALDGNKLYTILQNCDLVESGDHTIENTITCTMGMGYVAGVFDALHTFPDTSEEVCSPSVVTQFQLKDVVFQWMKSNPGFRSLSGDRNVFLAVVATWQCPKD